MRRAWVSESSGNGLDRGVERERASGGCNLQIPDGDGQSNTAEYVIGTGLTSGSDFFKVQTTTMATDSFSLTVNDVAGRTYRLQHCASLTTGICREIANQGPLASNELLTLTDASPTAGQGFYRVTMNVP